jgi:hypothetical protein
MEGKGRGLGLEVASCDLEVGSVGVAFEDVDVDAGSEAVVDVDVIVEGVSDKVAVGGAGSLVVVDILEYVVGSIDVD